MQKNTTKQVEFWAGEFGNSYTERNQGELRSASVTAMFSDIFRHTRSIRSVLELGANRGLNMDAIHSLNPGVELSAVEVNEQAFGILQQKTYVEAKHSSIQDFKADRSWDLTFTRGVLIHIAPEDLSVAYQRLYEYSRRYILVAEYYNPTPVALEYREHHGYLFKRDFAGDLLDRYEDLSLISYGFCYHRDTVFPQDDITWFLMEKQQS
ncbi:pseudaminic acid biosynthesis-associated methylase [Thalassospira sp.]|uniref:pseudaminic acid biosynthesis-associated methylase n=1 Tax=Thalassospira sp. TaxID=1912094 RepID=UPI003AA8EF97